MSNREKLPELIDRYNSGTLTGDELTAFLEMMNNNPRIIEEVRLDKELNEILANQDILELRKKILSVQKARDQKKGPDFHYLLLAASLLFLIGIEVILFLNNKNPFHSAQTVQTHKITPIINKEQGATGQQSTTGDNRIADKKIPDRKTDTRIAANFRINPAYENMIGATRAGGSFRMVLPVPGHIYNANSIIRFKWIRNGKDLIELKIMDNTGLTKGETAPLKDNQYSFSAGSLKSGLYYYKVIQNDEILYLGKFVVE